MAGSISLAGAQQFDVLGRLLGGAKVYWIQAGTTSTPQNAYYDAGLVTPLPNPYTLEADARIPFHYLADGQIKVRIVDSNGVSRFEQDNILVIGPSSGEGGGGGVDPTTVFQTGDVMWLDVQGTRNGWVRDNGRTIGSAASGATERANADTSALFAFLWSNFSNTVCPVSTGRGANAAADFAANKTITLPDKRGYVPGGLDDMGNSAASRYTGVPVVSGDAITAGSVLGETTHTLTTAKIPQHLHAQTAQTPTFTFATSQFGEVGGGQTVVVNITSAISGNPVTTAADATPGDTGNTGNGEAHNNVQKTVLGTYFRKL